ncbi:hypothetical protein ACFQ0P_09715 [Microbacterium insulae]|uniref:Nucleotidyltransferase n=1 Tax=Microbacterium insulae TaxID=483014 RepID=A0ABW3AJ31_9MICO
MIDFNASDPRLLDGIDAVVVTLRDQIGLDADTIILVGAACRDILHSALGHELQLRGTEDTDIGIALNDWQIYDLIDHTFTKSGHTGVRYLVDGFPVDIMPFGGIEEPEGIVTPHSRGEEMVVFGFDDVYARAGHLTLPSGNTIRIPSPAGYAALKFRAWIDRSRYGQDKDGKDLAAAVYWYLESASVTERLWGTTEGNELLEEVGWDIELGAARVLGFDIRAQLSPPNLEDLIFRWNQLDLAPLGRALQLAPGANWPRNPERRLALISEVTTGWSSD